MSLKLLNLVPVRTKNMYAKIINSNRMAHKGKNNISKIGLKNMFKGIKKKLNGRTFKEFDFSQVKAKDSLDLTKAASVMLHHVGLYGYTPIIVHERLEENTAGYINMNLDMTFFITVDLNKFYLTGQRLCILSHEICHKFMYVNQFRDTGLKNEYLTDACAIYVGFGEMMLKGCQTTNVSYRDNKEITRTTNIGYLEKWQLSYLYYKKNPLKSYQKIIKVIKQIWMLSVDFITKSKTIFYVFFTLSICIVAYTIAFFIDGFETAVTVFFVTLFLLFAGWVEDFMKN